MPQLIEDLRSRNAERMSFKEDDEILHKRQKTDAAPQIPLQNEENNPEK